MKSNEMTSTSIDLADIDAIIFDLGGVIINICYENTIRAFSQLCGFDAKNRARKAIFFVV